jgi:hypothetical protein
VSRIASGRLAADQVGRGIRIRREAIEEFATPAGPTRMEAMGITPSIGRSHEPSDISQHKDEDIADSIETWRDVDDESDCDRLLFKLFR